MNKLLENNQVTLVGEIKTEFEFSHEVYGEKFYRFELSVERFSGTKDVLPVVVSERLIDGAVLLRSVRVQDEISEVDSWKA